MKSFIGAQHAICVCEIKILPPKLDENFVLVTIYGTQMKLNNLKDSELGAKVRNAGLNINSSTI